MIARLTALRPSWILAAIIALSGGATMLAMRRTSTTFDEVVLISAGARGWTNGKFDLAPDHPPMMQYLYGLPVYLTHPNYPSEKKYNTHHRGYRYVYARQFFWQSLNNPERLAFWGRFPAVIIAMLLVFTTYAFTRRAAGSGPALLAAALVAFLPDVLAHGGVAYNDVPLALTFFLALWAIHETLLQPTLARGALSGAAIGLALGVKISAVAIAPAGAVLTLLELVRRRADAAWLRKIIPAILVSGLATYLMLVAIYRGDFTLAQFRYALDFTFRHVTQGHGAAAYLLGRSSTTGFWYFFPVAFLYKTPAVLHALMVIAIVAAVRYKRSDWRVLLAHPLRVSIVAGAVFGALLLRSSLNIGFRYALPVLPHICILTAIGVAIMWAQATRWFRVVIAALVAWAIIGPLSYYPNYLAYISGYGPGRDRGAEVLVDSSYDWGQGLLQLRDYMREHNISRVYLSYFGSARPDGYGIDYIPLFGPEYSFFVLPPSGFDRPNAPPATHIVISATNIAGVYFNDDPFAAFRHQHVRRGTDRADLEAVIAHTMYIYRIQP